MVLLYYQRSLSYEMLMEMMAVSEITPKFVADYPNLLDEWNYDKNDGLNPGTVRHRSVKSVWWKCKNGHEWQVPVVQRTTKGGGCPYCSGHKPITGVNDLETVNPTLAAEWHPTKNGDLTPSTISKSSGKKVWWQCSEGHEWEATVINRNKKNSGCPYCSGRMAIIGVNDLATTNPDLVAEWHPTKNQDILPIHVTPGSQKVVWWQCSEGHEWESSVTHRSNGTGCPYCSGRKAIEGTNDVATLNPSLAAEWHPTKNGEMTPSDVLPYSNKKYWWICEKGHEWQAVVASRSYGRGCPYCKGINRSAKRISYIIAKNGSLESNFPALAAEWHPTLNGELHPSEVTVSSGRKVWWKCSTCGHEWDAIIGKRSKGAGCPKCKAEKDTLT